LGWIVCERIYVRDLNEVIGCAIAQIRGGLYIGIGLFAQEYICGFEWVIGCAIAQIRGDYILGLDCLRKNISADFIKIRAYKLDEFF